MNDEYAIGKDVGELRASMQALSEGLRGRSADCSCKGARAERRTSELTPENLRILRLMHDNSEQIRKGIEEVFSRLGIQPAQGGQLNLVAFSVVDPQDTSATPMSPWGPLIMACCSDGTYKACFSIGCDPCAG